MSKPHRIKGTSTPLTERQLPPRASRHGKPLADVYRVPAKVNRIVVERDGKEVVIGPTTITPARPMTPEEIQAHRKVRVAVSSTLSWGKKNGTAPTPKKKAVA